MTTTRSNLCRPLALATAALAGCANFQPADVTEEPNNIAAASMAMPNPAMPSATPNPVAISTGAFIDPDDTIGSRTRADNASFAIASRIMMHAAEPSTGAPGAGDSGNVTQVSFAPEGADFDPDVSRDGKTIVFASTQHRATADLYLKSTDGRTITQITGDPSNDLMPRFSPDGTRIAFASDRAGNWDIYVMPATGGKPIQITSGSAHELHPSWSPDGTEIVFCRLGESSGLWEMWVTGVNNPGVARFLGNGLFPEWCPVSGTGIAGADRIAFQKSRERGDRAFGIWVMDYKSGEAGNSTELASLTTAACINPSWSPDGQWLAYATVPNPSQWSADCRPAWAELWMVDASGNNRTALTGGHFVNLMPTWGPQNRLFFISDRGGTDTIWSMDTSKVVALAAANAKPSTAFAAHPPTPNTAPKAAPAPKPIVTVPENHDQAPH